MYYIYTQNIDMKDNNATTHQDSKGKHWLITSSATTEIESYMITSGILQRKQYCIST